METVALRIERHMENGLCVAEFLRPDRRVDWVKKPLYLSEAGKRASQMEAFRRVTDVIVPLSDNETGPAFYCVHPLGGGASGYAQLACLLGPDIRLFGIQVPTKLRTPEFPVLIESMARLYVDALVHAQPDGPILLGGFSVGVTIALEMARQLSAAGRYVSLLVAIDKAPENVTAGISCINPLYYAKLLANAPHWMTSTWRDQARRHGLVERLRALGQTRTPIALAEKKPARHPIEDFVNVASYLPSHVAFMRALYDAAFRYEAKEYPGNVVVYEAKETPLHRLPQVGAIWKKLAPQANVIRLKGSHNNIVNAPHAIPLASDLRERLLASARLKTAGPNNACGASRCLSQEEVRAKGIRRHADAGDDAAEADSRDFAVYVT